MKKLIEGSRNVLFAAGVIVLVLIGAQIAMVPANLIDAWFDDTVEADPALVAEFNTPAMQERIEWVYEADERLGTFMSLAEDMEFERELLVKANDGAPESEWSIADKQQLKQWKVVMDAVLRDYGMLAATYNAEMGKLSAMVPDGADLGGLNGLLLGLPDFYPSLKMDLN